MKFKIALGSLVSGIIIVILFMIEMRLSHKGLMVNPEILYGISIYGLIIAIAGIISSLLWLKGKSKGLNWKTKMICFLFVVLSVLSAICILFCSMILGSSSSYATIKSARHNKVFKLIGEFCPTDISYQLVSGQSSLGLIYKVIADGQISYSEDGSLISNEQLKLSTKEKYLAIIRNGFMTDLYNIERDSVESDSSFLFSTRQDTSTWKRHSKINEAIFNADN